MIPQAYSLNSGERDRERRQDHLVSRVLKSYFIFRENNEAFSEEFLVSYASHLGIDCGMVRMAYNHGSEELRQLLITHPQYVVAPAFDKMH